jgi:hypothetical protein
VGGGGATGELRGASARQMDSGRVSCSDVPIWASRGPREGERWRCGDEHFSRQNGGAAVGFSRRWEGTREEGVGYLADLGGGVDPRALCSL